MASSSIPNDQFASGFVTLIGQFKANTITAAAFATQLTTLVDQWDAYTPAQLAASVNSFVSNQRIWQKELRDWWTGTTTGGPNNDGYYPFTNDLGVTALVPSPAFIHAPAGQAANAAIRAENAANNAAVTAAGIAANSALIGQQLAWAQANATAAASSASTATTANTNAWTAKAGADSAKTGADTANTNAQAARVAAQANATAAAGSASTATTANTNAWTAKTAAETANTNAWAAKVATDTANANAWTAKVSTDSANASAWTARNGAATSEANALTYRNTTLTYRDQATANATIAVGNAVAAAASSNTATTRAIAAETAQAAAEAALIQARNAANAAAASAANAASTVGFNIADYQARSEKGQANGYASLDNNGKVPIAQLDTAVLGGLKYMGTWNASTNSPTIPTANSTNKGQYYKVGTAGTTSVGGYTDWQVGDWVLSDGTIWDKIDNTDQVQSVAGKTGAVTLAKADVGLGNVDNTSDANKPVSTAAQAALNLKLDIASKATTTQAIVGADDTTWMTPAKTSAAITNAIASRTQFSSTVIATGSSQTVDLGQDIAAGELLIFVNGVEQNTTDFTKSGTQWTFTRPAGSTIRFMLPGGVRGQSFKADASGTTAGRSTYDTQPVGFSYLATDTGTFSWRTGSAGTWTSGVSLTGPQGAQGSQGNAGVNGSNGVNGWSPVISIVADAARYVAKVTDWTGGTTGKPTANVFISSGGFTSNVALATDIRGPQGLQGPQGNAGVNGSNGVSAVYSTTLPLGMASANAVGIANVAARSDHVHQFPLAIISQAPIANATLTLADHGGVVEWNATANGTITLPNNLPQGFNCLVRVVAATVPTFTPAAGASMRQADGLTKARKQWSEVSVSVRANANGVVAEYVLSGDMA